MLSPTKSRNAGKSFLKILFFFLLVTQFCFAQWYQQNSGTTEALYSVQFINDTVGLTAGGLWAPPGAKILKTSNGGITWDQQPTGLLYELFDLYFINENKGWAVGDAGAIITTSVGGANWTQQQQPFGSNCKLNSVYFLNENLGWTVGGGVSGAVILKTTDGGMNWISQTADTNLSFISLRDVFIINENIGWIVGGNYDTSDPQGILLKTTDGGANWTNIDYGRVASLSAIQFLNENIGWFTCYIKIGIMRQVQIYMTTNGGENWTPSLMGMPALNHILAIHFINENLGWAVDGFYGGVYGSRIFKTTDGGWSWEYDSSGTNNIGLLSIFFVDSICGWAVGDGGTILHTTNGGVTFIDEYELNEIPTKFLLSQNYPNPFNSSSVIKYSIPKTSQVTLKIFNTLGQEIEALVNEEKTVGTYELTWNAANLPSGVYFYRLQAGSFVQTRKMILLK